MKKWLGLYRVPLFYATLVTLVAIWDWSSQDINTRSLLISFIFTYVSLISLYMIHPILCKIMMGLFILCEAILIFVYHIAHFNVLPEIIPVLIAQTNYQEVLRFSSWKLVVFTILCIYISFKLFSLPTPKRMKLSQSKQRLYQWLVGWVLVLLLFFPVNFYLLIFEQEGSGRFPMPYVLTFHLRHRIVDPLRFLFKNPIDYSHQIVYDKKRPLKIYLMIGESVRGDHLGINGYKRETTPLLAKEDLVNFGVNKSCGNMTYISWKHLFYQTQCIPDSINYPQVPYSQYFSNAGFNTRLVSQDDESSMLSVGRSVQIREGIKQMYDDNLYEAFKKDSPISHRELLILNSFGSHIPYEAPKVPLDNLFTPYEDHNPNLNYKVIFRDSPQKLINTYDNTIRFLDWQLDHIIHDLKDSKDPVILLYTSDHGEMLNENHIGFGHGGKPIENYMVPFFVWTNRHFQEQYAAEYKNLKENARRYKNRLTHEVMFHSILSLGGFKNQNSKYSVIDSSQNIFGAQFKPLLDNKWAEVPYQRN